MNRQTILLVLTGGTIGSAAENGVRGVGEETPFLLPRAFRERCPAYAGLGIDVICPFRILSENLTPAHWQTLYDALTAVNQRDYAGIIITHGSDTLAYTAAAMGMLLRHFDIPVVFVAADRPVPDPLSNALPNFRAAVDFILHGGVKGVFVSYRRYDTLEQAIYLATRLCSADNFCDEFSAYGGVPLGTMCAGTFCPADVPRNPTERHLNLPFAPIAPDGFTLSRKVMLLRAYPGLDYSAVSPEGFAAVVQYGYHSATACTEGTDTSLLTFAERCAACNTALWLGAFKREDDEMYATSRALLDSGILPFYDMSPEAAYAKAVLAYNLCAPDSASPWTEPEAFMKSGIYFENDSFTADYRGKD